MADRSKYNSNTTLHCSDEEWVQQTLRGRTACFEHIVDRYSVSLIRFIYGRVQCMQDAEDICQETFLKAYRSLHTYDLRSSFKTWLFSIAYHEVVSFLRKKKVPTCPRLSEIPDPESTETPTLFSEDEIWSAARCLPPDQYMLLWLKYKENLSIQQISEISGKSRLYARVILHRARKKLADILRPSLEEEEDGVPFGQGVQVSCSIQGESNVL